MSIRENRLLPINNKVFSRNHIYALAEEVSQEYEKVRKSQPTAWLLFSVKCFDHSSFESEDLELFKSESIITRKRVKSIIIEFRCDKEKYVKIRLNHGYIKVDDEKITDSDLEVGGEDPIWVGGILDKLTNIIYSVPDQFSFGARNSTLILWLLFFLGTYLWGALADVFEPAKDGYDPYWSIVLNDIETSGGLIITALLFGGVPFWLISMFFLGDIKDTWPPTELQIGPEHFAFEKKRRIFMGRVWTLVLLPIIVSIISSIFYAKIFG